MLYLCIEIMGAYNLVDLLYQELACGKIIRVKNIHKRYALFLSCDIVRYLKKGISMKNRIVSSFCMMSFSLSALAIDLSYVSPYQGTDSIYLKSKSVKLVSGKYDISLLAPILGRFLEKSLQLVARNSLSCDFALLETFKAQLGKAGIDNSVGVLSDYLLILRINNLVDDYFYEILMREINVAIKADQVLSSKVRTTRFSEPVIGELLAPMQTWPNNKDYCVLDMWGSFSSAVEKELPRKMSQVLKRGVQDNLISSQVYANLEALRTSDVAGWPIYMSRYMDILKFAKNKLVDVRKDILLQARDTGYEESISELSKNSKHFLEKSLQRRKSLTRKEYLYQRYNSTQVMLIAEVMLNAIKRMEAEKVSILWELNTKENESYVLAPMEQYRLSLKMLYKDMKTLANNKAMNGMSPSFEDVVMASLETGLITTNELDAILGFDDFWNPKVPKWQAITNVVFQAGGMAAFFAPAPFNIVAAVGVVVSQTLVNKKTKKTKTDNLEHLF